MTGPQRGLIAVRMEDGRELYALAEKVTITMHNDWDPDTRFYMGEPKASIEPHQTDIEVEALRVTRWFVRMPTEEDLRHHGLSLPAGMVNLQPTAMRRLPSAQG
jgi:hypothetical protein